MPYVFRIPDRQMLDPWILRLYSKVIGLLDNSEMHAARSIETSMWGYMQYIAITVLRETALNAAEQYQGQRRTRYWLVADQGGIPSNICFEIIRRILDKFPDSRPVSVCLNRPNNIGIIPLDAGQLNTEISGLIRTISDLGGPERHNYDGAYNGEVNYSLFELMPRIVIRVRKLQGDKFTLIDVEKIILFWTEIAKKLYSDIATPYEKKQSEANGDVPVVDFMLRELKSKD